MMARRTHKEIVQWERAFPTGRRGGYPAFVEDIRKLRDSYYAEFLKDKSPRLATIDEVIAAFGKLPPEEFSEAYDLSDEDLEGRLKHVQRKYMLRFKNIRRSWAMLLQYMPELMSQGRKRNVLEMSTAHGATLEILRNFGHEVRGNDFPNFLTGKTGVDSRFRGVNEHDLTCFTDDHGLNDGDQDNHELDWIYRPITESIGLEVDLFDGGHLPYPYEDKSFDFICCMDAIEHYCHPKDWLEIVNEFVRISRESVLIITNPVQGHLVDDESYMKPFYKFHQDMQSYSRDGFGCVLAGVHRNQLTVFKLLKTGT